MIVFSGIDCSGKSTQIDLLTKFLSEKGIKYRVIWSRVGYTPIIEFCKSIICRNSGESESRRDEYRKKVQSDIKKRKILLFVSILDLIIYYGFYFRLLEMFGIKVLADRYLWDSYIDLQIKYTDINLKKWMLWKLLSKIALTPKKSIIFILSADESLKRSELKYEPFPETLEEREFRIQQYIEEIKHKHWEKVIDAMKPVDEIHGEILEYLNED